MLVTCKICKEKIDRDTAYKITTVSPTSGKKTNSYFCSEAEWQAEEDRKNKARENKDKVYYLICDMFGYEIVNTKFFDEWHLWNKLKSNEIIYKYLRDNETYLQQICNKSFDNEYQRIRYFSAVLKNSLRDYVPKGEVKEVPSVTTSAFEFFEPIVERQPEFKEQVLYDVEDDLI